MTREEAIKDISELRCPFKDIPMTDCPACSKEVENLVKILTGTKETPPESEREKL